MAEIFRNLVIKSMHKKYLIGWNKDGVQILSRSHVSPSLFFKKYRDSKEPRELILANSFIR